MQPIKDFKAGDELVAYIDTRGNLRVYDGKKRSDITNLNVEYKVSDHLLGYKIGPTLNIWDDGELSTLTYFARHFEVRDSLIYFDDTRFNSMNVYWQDSSYIYANNLFKRMGYAVCFCWRKILLFSRIMGTCIKHFGTETYMI